MMEMEDVDDMVAFFTEHIIKCLDICAPWKTKKRQNKRFRFPENVKNEIKKAKVLLKQKNYNIENGIVDEALEIESRKQNNYANALKKKTVRKENGYNITPESSTKEIWKCLNERLSFFTLSALLRVKLLIISITR